MAGAASEVEVVAVRRLAMASRRAGEGVRPE
jgi:hypothetical protein